VTDDLRNRARGVLPRLTGELGEAESIEAFGNTLTTIERILLHKVSISVQTKTSC
jgi:hypothetical protein